MDPERQPADPPSPLRADAVYRANRKALRRWARERLTLTPREDGGTDAVFRYDGTTCTNMGRELAFLYTVTLGPSAQGYPIRAQHCAPAPGDQGHTAMCGYLKEDGGPTPATVAPTRGQTLAGSRTGAVPPSPHPLLAAIASERPLVGRPLDDVLSWARPSASAGCFCDAASREHKWGLVLETIHFALAAGTRSTL